MALAIERLEARQAVSDAALHEVRKHLKAARAALRLLRDAVGKPAYARENAAIRKVAARLSPLRDAKVLLDTVRALQRTDDRELRELLAAEQRALRAEHRTLRAQLSGRALRRSLAAQLQQAAERTGRWRMPRDGWRVSREGVRRIYRSGRRAAAAAASEPTDRNLHEARKQAKYLELALQMLFPAQRLQVAARAHFIAEKLGLDHDLAVLQKRIAGASRAGAGGSALKVLRRRRSALQRRALQRAAGLYRRKPRAFVQRLDRARGAGRFG